jgi:hypothetical protein
MLPMRNIAHPRAGVMRDERTQHQGRLGDCVVRRVIGWHCRRLEGAVSCE